MGEPPSDTDHAELLNQHLAGLNRLLDLRFVRATEDEVVAEVPVTEHLLQPYGLVHGGVYSAIAETVASSGAALTAMRDGRHTVGLENHTTFLRGVRDGTLRATGVPLARGRRSHVWQVDIRDERGRFVARGQVRMLVLEPDASVAGERVELKGE